MWTKYATRAPRYTSYPTAPLFSETFDPEFVESEYRRFAERRDMSLYIHIPYCERRCLFCGCHLFISKDHHAGGPYVDRLLAEAEIIAKRVGRDHRVMQLALGGGTPNFLLIEDMQRLIDGLRAIWEFPEEGERSIEIDVRTTDNAYMDRLLDMGFNRVSFGVQDLHPDVVSRVRKHQSQELVEAIVSHLLERKIQALNFDLIYGLPGQNPERFGQTIDETIRMRPSRIALFGYAHVPWMKSHQKVLERYGLPDEKERVQLWGIAFEKFRDAGYVPIGMDHFAEPHDELAQSQRVGRLNRNFMGYTTARGLDLVGLGVSSIASVGDVYVQNRKEIPPYMDDVDAGRLPWQKALTLSTEDKMRRDLIIDLFSNFTLDAAAFEKTWNVDFWKAFAAEREKLEPLAADGLVNLGDTRIDVTPLGRFFIRNICTVFDQYLDPTTQRFSKTV
ncbi:MAG: oxygen-independent coproporphyrinogen III oxidase [Deltaproteobacteria bacterium]|nr:oxygen-independent coproporphyrinogen III oxidase [Deltaproteobacteria bacterium]